MEINNYSIRVKIFKDAKAVVIDAIDIPLVTQGRNEQEAVSNFSDAFNVSMKDPDFAKQAEQYKLENQQRPGDVSTAFVTITELTTPHAEVTDNYRNRTNSTA